MVGKFTDAKMMYMPNPKDEANINIIKKERYAFFIPIFWAKIEIFFKG